MFLKHYFILLCFIFITISSGISQSIKSFSKGNDEFIAEASKFLVKQDVKESKDALIISFKNYWNSGNIDEVAKKNIYKTSNAFLKRKARAYPTYSNYIKCLLLFEEKTIDKKNFDIWHKHIFKLTKNRRFKLSSTDKLLEQTIGLLSENIIYKSFSVVWKGKNLMFDYQIVDKKIAISFAPFDLYCYSQRDSSKIDYTTGLYFPIEKKWIGNKGKVTWQKAGSNPEYEFALFNKYNINMTKNYFSVDTVKYFNSKLTSKGVLGRMEDKTIKIARPEKAIYPKFYSFDNDIEFKNIFKNINYKGGIQIKGSNFYSKIKGSKPAELSIQRNDTCFLRAYSRNFSFTNNKITATESRIEILLGDNMIEHPGLIFNYNNSKREVSLIRNGVGNAMSPYFNSYHNIIMDFEMMVWNLYENKIHCRKMYGANNRIAKFESINYFSKIKYRKLKAMDEINPLVNIKRYSKKYNSETLTAREYAQYAKKPVNQIRQQLIKLSFEGFVAYNPISDEIKILRRLSDYILADIGKKDYDVIKFNSQTDSNTDNATLNLDSYNLKINGVRQITVSDSQNVKIAPRFGKFELKKNLNFDFDGIMSAGLLTMYGNDFHFVYKDFKVHLNSIDSVQIHTPRDTNTRNRFIKPILVNNVIEKVTGDLSIDDPNNKSGLKKSLQFPIFNSIDTSFVYYSKKKIQKGAYKKEDFYFKLDPFTINRINKFKPRDLQLTGEFVSYKIFPNIDESLTIMNDYSLGFERETPPEGYKIYGDGEGVFRKKIILNRRGLTGDGELDFINSTTKAKDFLFLPRKAIANAYSFKLEEGERKLNPNVEGDSIFTRWLPYDQELYITSKDIPFNMYSNFATLSGILKITPENITGDGRMELKDAKLDSKYYSYTRTSISADTALFKIYNEDRKTFAFVADSVHAYIDLEKETGLFKTTIDDNISKFPENEYLCYLNNFMWYMEDNNIKFGSKNKDLIAQTWADKKMSQLPVKSMSKFVSTRRGQDSLFFYTPMAHYDVTNKIIEANYVYSIDVADAVVYPEDGKIIITKKAKIKTIENAIIKTGKKKHIHTIENAQIDIFGRYNFSGNGEYNYIDKNDSIQKIKLSFIDVDKQKQTRAKGSIGKKQNFTLSPNFGYKGEVTLRSQQDYLQFEGESKINRPSENIDDEWFKFKASINPDNIRIPIADKILSSRDSNLFANLFISKDSSYIYPSFMSRKRDTSDLTILKPKGFLTYRDNEYIIAPKEKIDSMSLPGNIIRFSKAGIKGRGKLDLGLKYKFIDQICSGFINYDFGKLEKVSVEIDSTKTDTIIKDNSTVSLDLIYGIDFPLQETALKVLQETFIGAKLKMSLINRESNYSKLSELIGSVQASKAISKMNENGYYKDIPAILEKTLFFNKLNLEWNKEKHAYISVGKISIGNIGKKQINRITNGKIELQKREFGDVLRIYLSLESSVWFYFEYSNGKMYTLSSEGKYNNVIKTTNIKGRKKRKKKKKSKSEIAKDLENKNNIDKQIAVKKYFIEIANSSQKLKFLQSLDSKEKTENKEQKKDTTIDSSENKTIKTDSTKTVLLKNKIINTDSTKIETIKNDSLK